MSADSKKELYIVGLGPGARQKMTQEAIDVVEACEVIAGYKVYIDLLKPYYPDKEYLVNGMRQEVERCRLALETAAGGKKTALVCSGDAGVYGMAGITLELATEFPEVDVHVIPGVTAALSGAALLGAPLGHDFTVISLSDLLTPWELIERRLAAAAEGDFAICLYNPSSHKRHDYLQKACQILLQKKSGDTICGITRNIGRDGEEKRILTLDELLETQVDMFTTVFIGNSQTRKVGDAMVTPRGYRRDNAESSHIWRYNGGATACRVSDTIKQEAENADYRSPCLRGIGVWCTGTAGGCRAQGACGSAGAGRYAGIPAGSTGGPLCGCDTSVCGDRDTEYLSGV